MKKLGLAFCFLLAGCTGGPSLMEKPGPVAVNDQSLIHPPWEALVKAGPGAAKDIDLETLTGQAPGQVPQPPVSVPAPPPPTQLVAAQTPPEAAPQKSSVPVQPKPAQEKVTKPGAAPAVEIKAVAVVAVKGASAQGNQELTTAMRQVLKESGWPVVYAPQPDALTLVGQVKLDPAQGSQQQVHISWQVTTPKGRSLGRIDQNNAVAAHSLDSSWGDSARFASEAAAEGIFKLINQFR